MPSTNFFHVRNVIAFLEWIASQNLVAVPGAGSTAEMFSVRPKPGHRFNLCRNGNGDFLEGLSHHLSANSVGRVDSGEAISLAFPRGVSWGD